MALIAVLGLIFFITGLVLMVKSQSTKSETHERSEGENREDDEIGKCAFSAEAKRVGLLEFLKRIDSTVRELHPYDAGFMTGVSVEEMKKIFQPYNPTPESIKAISERAHSMLKELRSLKIDKKLLLASERRMIAKTDHFLKHYFGRPFENNYLAGYWMLGPGRYCSRTFKGITSIKKQLSTVFLFFTPQTASELEEILNLLAKFKTGINQFKENLKSGIRTGMVGSVTVCKEGRECLEDIYIEVSSQQSGRGILSAFQDQISTFVSKISSEEAEKIIAKHGMNGTVLVEESLVRNVGSPLLDLFEYFENEHLPHCLPTNISSGLGTLPVDHVYLNGSKTLERTNPTFREGDTVLPGKDSYKNFLSYYTTQDITPAEVQDLGWEMLEKLYRQAVDIAKTIMGQDIEETAVNQFAKYLNSTEMYFNENPFPENESNEEAFRKCKSEEAAQNYCPERYKTMLKWLDLSRKTMSRILPKLTGLFYFTGNKTTVPTCPVAMEISFVPLQPVQSYSSSTSSCRTPGKYNVPFFVDRMGPKYFEFTVNALEASPGHHLQSQGYKENFGHVCEEGVNFQFLRDVTAIAIREGWGLYSENPLATQDTDLYQNRILERYGALKGQIWRALRLIIDTGLHSKNMTRDEAINLFQRYMWDYSDVVPNEVSRYEAYPGQATAYMTGQLAIWRMRNETSKKLGANFKIQDFHYQVLSQGEVPISYLQTHIEEYTNCVLHEGGNGCSDTHIMVDEEEHNGQTSAIDERQQRVMLEKLNQLYPADSYIF
ncbi:uncharacterized protein LOC111320683 isoform X1 [Stylophora pistillata]|uniref:uncharacterized protein LOC111320683 isoform X1 n=1 Tax=Stylophora pistillata TaxID=50429 RepID=UPI000C04563B|nr:uncharacterized protein LOC111320683 isoform X1 [Stylophora pistillata]